MITQDHLGKTASSHQRVSVQDTDQNREDALVYLRSSAPLHEPQMEEQSATLTATLRRNARAQTAQTLQVPRRSR